LLAFEEGLFSMELVNYLETILERGQLHDGGRDRIGLY
jgi:hypothetical protein